MNGILPTYLTQHSLWSLHQSVFNAYALELFAFLQGKAPARSPGEKPALPEAQYLEVSKTRKVSIIPITGMIIPTSDYEFGMAGLDHYKRLLMKAENESAVVGHVLHINSGGGSVMQLAEFAEFIRYGVKKPIVAYTSGFLASAAYYIAMACDWIISTPYSGMIANIGTVFKTIDMVPAMEKLGAVSIEIYGEEATEKNLGYNEAKAGNPEKYKSYMVTPFQDMFLDDVAKYRPSVSEDATTGAIYLPTPALEKSLIDAVGPIESAIVKILEFATGATHSTPQTSNKMNLTVNGVAAWLGLVPKAGADAELSFDEAVELKTKAESLTGLEAKVTELTTTNATLTTQNSTLNSTVATLTTDKEALEAKVTELQAKLDEKPGTAAAAPVKTEPDKLENLPGEVTGKMEGEDEFKQLFGY